jgi:hypothetical protein
MGCSTWVARQKKRFLCTPEFLCKAHGIYISRTTFEYADENANLLWASAADLTLLDAINRVKRESRMARDNSEDAVTWNVFRFLETSNMLGAWLESIAGAHASNPRLIYWSYCQDAKATWRPLSEAQMAFGEDSGRGSEPDLIVDCDASLFFIEAKLTSGNHTTPSDPSRHTRYEAGGEGWFQKVIASDFNQIAVAEKRYELMRFWLLGSWAASRAKKPFYLVNLVREESEQSIVKSLTPHFLTTPDRRFLRATWEDICRFVAAHQPPSRAADKLRGYMAEKTLGYGSAGNLRLAFSP